MIHNTHKIYCITLLFISLFISCNDSDFSTGKKSSLKKNTSGDAVASLSSTKSTPMIQEFAVKKDSVSKQLPLRMLWLIDNSGSMEDDVSAVQNGIKGFVNSITTSSYEDVNVTFVSCQESSISRCLNPSRLSHSTISTVNLQIDSLNDLEIAAMLLVKDHFKQLPTPNDEKAEWLWKLLGSKHPQAYSLKDYFQPNYTNVIISVSDDRADVPGELFLKFLKANYGSIKTFRYYGFISHEHGTPESYIYLAKELGGKTFDIQSNSAPYATFFKELSEEIKKTIGVSSFKLSSSCQAVEHVLVDGVAIDTSLYSCADQELNINQYVLENANNVSVKYYAK